MQSKAEKRQNAKHQSENNITQLRKIESELAEDSETIEIFGKSYSRKEGLLAIKRKIKHHEDMIAKLGESSF